MRNLSDEDRCEESAAEDSQVGKGHAHATLVNKVEIADGSIYHTLERRGAHALRRLWASWPLLLLWPSWSLLLLRTSLLLRSRHPLPPRRRIMLRRRAPRTTPVFPLLALWWTLLLLLLHTVVLERRRRRGRHQLLRPRPAWLALRLHPRCHAGLHLHPWGWLLLLRRALHALLWLPGLLLLLRRALHALRWAPELGCPRS